MNNVIRLDILKFRLNHCLFSVYKLIIYGNSVHNSSIHPLIDGTSTTFCSQVNMNVEYFCFRITDLDTYFLFRIMGVWTVTGYHGLRTMVKFFFSCLAVFKGVKEFVEQMWTSYTADSLHDFEF
jgi:hypothetical protein